MGLEISEPFARYSPALVIAITRLGRVSKSVSLSLVTRLGLAAYGRRRHQVSKSVSLSLVTRRRVTADFIADPTSLSRNQ